MNSLQLARFYSFLGVFRCRQQYINCVYLQILKLKNTKEAWSAASPSHVTSSEQRSTTSPHEFSLSAASLFSGLPGEFFSCDFRILSFSIMHHSNQDFIEMTPALAVHTESNLDTHRTSWTSAKISNYLTKDKCHLAFEMTVPYWLNSGFGFKSFDKIGGCLGFHGSPGRKWSFFTLFNSSDAT